MLCACEEEDSGDPQLERHRAREGFISRKVSGAMNRVRANKTTDWIDIACRTWLQRRLGPGNVVLFLR